MTDNGGKKGFIPGLALALSIVALILVGVNALTGTTSEETLEKMMQAQFNKYSEQLDLQFQKSMEQIKQREDQLRVRELQDVREALGRFSQELGEEVQGDVDRILALVEDLEKKLRGETEPAVEQ